MKILVEIGHPAHVHFFRYPLSIWRKRGHDVLVVSRQKDLTNDLLRAFQIKALSISKAGRGALGLFREMVVRDFRLWRIARRFKPDIMTSIGGTWISQVSKLIRKPAVVFYDTENAVLSNTMTYPLVAALCTPGCYGTTTRLGERHLRYPGYHELSYLHPNRFKADTQILNRYHLTPSDLFFIVRFVGWGAGHDLTEQGLDFKMKNHLIELLSERGKVFVSSEAALPSQLKSRVSVVSSEHIHHLMAFSTMVVGESATMASEAAVLGVPAVYIADTTRGYMTEQERLYGLVYHYKNHEMSHAQEKIKTLLACSDLRDQWRRKREKMLGDMIDVCEFVVEMVEGFPASLPRYRQRWANMQQEGIVRD